MRPILFGLLLPLVSGCAREASPHPDVLFVIVDTLRRDHLSSYGYRGHPTSPALERLASEGVTFTGLTASSSWTKPSVATLFSGQEPSQHHVVRLFDPFEAGPTLAETFRKDGYVTACVQANFLLQRVWQGRATGFARGFRFYDDEIAARPDPHRGSSAAEVADRALSWLGEHESGDPWFLVLHFFDPHVAYEDHAGLAFEDPAYTGWVKGGLERSVLHQHEESCTPADRAQLAAFYDEEIRAVDDSLGRVLDRLRRNPRWKNTLVVFTADHGEELAERGYIGHTVSLHSELVDLPLVVRLPGGLRAGTRIAARVPEKDLFPTTLDLCGLPVPPENAHSFAAFLRGEEEPYDRNAFSEVDFQPANPEYLEKFTFQRAVTGEGFRLIADLKNQRKLLFDLEADPGERNDRYGDPAVAALQGRLEDLLRLHPWYRHP